MKQMIFGLLLLALSACSIAPINSPHSAKSLGKGNQEIAATPLSAPRLSYAAGVTDNFDLEASLEIQTGIQAALWGKYSFINQKDDGFALAGLVGGFVTADATESKGLSAGPILSWKKSWFEIYTITRFNYVKWEKTEWDNDNDIFDIETPEYDFTYLQSTLGFNFWFTPKFALNINGTIFYGSVFEGSAILPALEFIWKF